MRQIKILTAGPHASVQDFGRIGHQALGVPEGGALDRMSMRLANALVGNAPDQSVLEVCLGGLGFTAMADCHIALTGTKKGHLTLLDDTGINLDVPSYRSIAVKKGRSVRLGMLPDSNTAIIAISGGIDVPLLYGSMATSPNAMIGGFEGRLLRDGDILSLGDLHNQSDGGEYQLLPPEDNSDKIRIVFGPQYNRFTDAAKSQLINDDYTLTPVLNRMGMRLDGPPLTHMDTADIPSDGIVKGSIQVPGNGIPIILLADHQTTGGYTKIATVISSDLPKLARMRPGEKLRFEAVDVNTAEKIARKQEQDTMQATKTMVPAPPLVDTAALYGLGDTT